MKKTISILLSFTLIFTVLSGCGTEQVDTEESMEMRERILPNLNQFTAQTMDGGTFTQEDFLGKDVTMINVWSTTCPPCINEMPQLAELEKELPDNVQLITCCLDAYYVPDTAQNILTEAGFEGITLTEGDGDLVTFYGRLQYTPTTVLVDENGNMMGEPVIGSPSNPKQYYLSVINDALSAMGKPVIE